MCITYVMCVYMSVCVCVCVCVYIYILSYNGILFSVKKEGNPAIWDNMDEPGGHYAK